MAKKTVESFRTGTVPKLAKPNLSDAVACKSKTDADAFIETYAAYLTAVEGVAPEGADEKARLDVCYYAAIYHHNDLARVQELFGAKHPVYQAPEAAPGTAPQPAGQETRATQPAASDSGARTES